MALAENTTQAVGRRKCASAQVRLVPGKFKMTVNGRPFENFFVTQSIRGYIMQPLELTNSEDSYEVIVTVRGGGPMGQAGAVRHGIARALTLQNAELRAALKEAGMMTRDSRVKERKKPGQPGARKRFQFSKR